jgi:hypothetical protein
VKLYTKGSRVTQSVYGTGTVTSSDERYTVVEFDDHGERKFLTEVVTLNKSEQPAPTRPAKEKRKKAVPKAAKA